MIRTIIHIDEEKCTGCGLCAEACHEGAIEMVGGKARLVREDFCDGFGDCLPACPAGAIAFEEREAPAYNEAAVNASKQGKAHAYQEGGTMANAAHNRQGSGCPGSQPMQFFPAFAQMGGGMQSGQATYAGAVSEADSAAAARLASPAQAPVARPASQLAQWPCQLKLLPVEAPFYNGGDLLIAADCTAYAYAAMHEDFMKGRVTIIACPKLDMVDYSEKLAAIIASNNVRSVTLVRMDVPCCGGLQRAAENALRASGKALPYQVVTISRDGRIL